MENPLESLIWAYLVEAWPFALMHLLCICIIFSNLIALRRERIALQNLDGAKAGDRTLAAVLAQFRSESVRLGSQGFIIPLTDFSDRLDARAEELTGRLRDLVSTLLIIGIAGTMFGVFEFAAGAAGRLAASGQNDGLAASPAVINSLAELLATSMAKAFPVGIIGLLLTFIFQVVAGRAAQRLQDALSQATQEALQARSEHTVSPSEQLVEAAREVRVALTPLQDLKQTLSETLQPVIESFGGRLDKALQGIDDQLNGISTVTEQLRAATGSLADGVGTLSDQTTQFKELVSEAPRMVKTTIELQEKAEESLVKVTTAIAAAAEAAEGSATAVDKAAQKVEDIPLSVNAALEEASAHLAKGLDPTLGALRQAAQALARAPDELSTRLQPALDEFGKRAQVTWRSASVSFAQGVQNEHIQFLSKTKDAVAHSTSALKQAGDNLARLATNWDNRIQPAIEKTVRDVLVAQYPKALQVIVDVERALQDAAKSVASGTAAADSLVGQIRAVCSALENLKNVQVAAGDGAPDASLIQPIREDIRKGTAVLEEIRDHTPTIAIGPLFRRKGRK